MYGKNLQYITEESANKHLELISDHTNAEVVASNLPGNLLQLQEEVKLGNITDELFRSRTELALVIFEDRELYEECRNLLKLFPFLKKDSK